LRAGSRILTSFDPVQFTFPSAGLNAIGGFHGSAKCLERKDALVTRSSRDDLSVVLVTNDAAELAVAKSLLDAEGVECDVEGESGQETLGLGPLPGATGPMRLLVARKDEEAARGLLAQRRK
jgi:hypothetical protein